MYAAQEPWHGPAAPTSQPPAGRLQARVARPLAGAPMTPRAAMAHVPWLDEVDSFTLDGLARQSQLRQVRKGDCLAHQDDQAQQLGVLVSGRAHAQRQANPNDSVLLALVRPGDTFGELSLLDGQPQSASVRAVQHCLVLDIDHDALMLALARSAALRQALTLVMTRRLREANHRIRLMALHPVRDRVMQQLQAWAVQQADGGWLVVGDATRTELAGLIGASREMVSRALQRLRSGGQVQQRGRRTLVLYPEPPYGPPSAPQPFPG